MALTTTWTQQDAVGFNQTSIASTANMTTEVETNLQRGTLSATTTPSTTQVTSWLIRAKERLMELYGFTWKRTFSYADTVASTYRYALPKDFAGGGTILRDLTQDERLSFVNPISFDTMYPDPAGSSNAIPKYYTIKDRELWLSSPATGVYRLELEYDRSGEDSTAETWDYLPEAMLFKLSDYATYRAFLSLQQWDAAQAYKGEWHESTHISKKDDAKKKWAQMNYMIPNWHYKR